MQNHGQNEKVRTKSSKERAGPVDREHTANIMKTLHSLRDQGIGTDLTLRCKDGEFSAHSIILLTSDLSGRVKDSRDGIMDLSDLPSSGVAVLLDYIYLGRARLSLENGLSALEVSRRLNIPDLFDKCRKFICPFMLDPSKMGSMRIPVLVEPELTMEKRIAQKLDSVMNLQKAPAEKKVTPENEKFKTVENSKIMAENPKNLNPLPANMQSAVKRILPTKPHFKPISNSEPQILILESTTNEDDDKSEVESIASSASNALTDTETVTPSSSDNDGSSVTESTMTGNDSDHSTETTSSLGSLANKRERKPKRQKSVKWV